MEKLDDFLGQGSTAGEKVSQAPANSGVEFAKHQLVGDFVFYPQARRDRLPMLLQRAHLPADIQAPIKDCLFGAGTTSRHGGDASVHFLVDSWHAEHKHRFDFLHIVRQSVDAFGKGGGQPKIDARIRFQTGKGMGQGEK